MIFTEYHSLSFFLVYTVSFYFSQCDKIYQDVVLVDSDDNTVLNKMKS